VSHNKHPLQVRIGPHGRVVIPSPLRRALKLEVGEDLVARLEGEQLIFERREALERRLRQRFAHIPKAVNLADELIAERRDETRREADG
jgi:bifunctional DNA-binding transcriptional regulator/antitoxin component of YhaV-PrlF toxin-antitoxin module